MILRLMLGNYIKLYRKQHQHDSARPRCKGSGFTYQQVQKYENGSCNISLNRLYDIIHGLNMPVSVLLEIFHFDALPHHIPKGAHILEHFHGIENINLRQVILDICKHAAEEPLRTLQKNPPSEKPLQPPLQPIAQNWNQRFVRGQKLVIFELIDEHPF